MSQNPEEKWHNCLAIIRGKLPEQQFRTWFDPIEYVGFEGNELTLGVPNKFLPDYVEGHFFQVFRQALISEFGEQFRLQYSIRREPFQAASTEPAIKLPVAEDKKKKGAQSPQEVKILPLDPQLSPRYTFENFVRGESNKLPLSVALSITEEPGKSTFNPFFLYGPSGVGKTHLVNAIGVRIRERMPEKRVLFVSAHLFKTQYTDSVIHNTSNDFINFYQTIDVLIVDDIQEITTTKTQLAFFHIFNHLQQNGRQIIITCDRSPALFEGIEERMLTRFKWGMVAELERPDIQLRRDILISKTRRDGLDFPDEVIQYIATHVESSVRELEGIINAVMAYSVVDNCEIDLELTKRIVSRAVKLEKKEISAESITAAVCKKYKVKQREIVSKSRKQTVAQARQVAMFLCHKYTEMTYVAIGRDFGNRDHSTVLYACTRVAQRISSDKDFRHQMEALESTLK